MPLRSLLLDPGNELGAIAAAAHDIADDIAPDPTFLRAFIPLRAYQRLAETDLGALTSSIVRNPMMVDGHVVVQAHEAGGYVVVDGAWHVTALRKLANETAAHGVELPDDVTALAEAFPVREVAVDADPAFVLALMAPTNQRGGDPWLHGQRDRLLAQLADGGARRSVTDVTDKVVLRRFHAYRALGQYLQDHPTEADAAAALFPIFHVALARTVVRDWLDWDDHMCLFLDDDAVEVFYRLLQDDVDVDGSVIPAGIRTIDDVVHLCDVLDTPAAKRALVERGASLAEAVRVVEDGSLGEWVSRLGNAVDSMKWDRARFRSRY